MADNLIALNEAAALLGTSAEELLELRSAGEIHGYRDGASWKFKRDEIKRVADARGIQLPDDDDAISGIERAIEGSGMNLSDSSFGLDGDLGLSTDAGFLQEEPIDLSEEIELVDDDDDVVEIGSDVGSDIGSVIDLDELSADTGALEPETPDSNIDDMIDLVDEEVEPVAETPAPAAATDQGEDIDDLLVDLDDIEEEDAADQIDSILVSEEALGPSGDTTSSTIIGKRQNLDPDSDIETLEDAGSGSKVELDPAMAGSSDLTLTPGDSSVSDLAGAVAGDELDSASADGVELAGSDIGSDIEIVDMDSALDLSDMVAAESGNLSDDDDELEMDLASSLELSDPSGAISEEEQTLDVGLEGGSDLDVEPSPAELELGSDLELSGSTGKLLADGSDSASSSGEDLDIALDSELILGDDEEVEMEEIEIAPAGGELADEDLGIGEGSSGENLALMAEGSTDSALEDEFSALDAESAQDILGDDDLSLELGEAPEVSLDDSGSGGSGSELGSDIALEAEDDDLDVMLAGSGLGSDLALGADSGINLSPTDSGLSLEEEPLDLGGSSIEQLELPEDDDMISLDDPSQSGVASQMKADDEFLLTPIEEAEDESSGSQVIALEDSEVYADADAQTMLGAGEVPQALVAADADMGMAVGAPGMTAQPMATTAPAPGLPEAKYSVWNVLSLMLVLSLLTICSTMMVDVMRNIWAFEEPSSVTTLITDWLVETIGFN